jgi:hypothetical protein
VALEILMSIELKSYAANSVTYYFKDEVGYTFTPADWAALPAGRVKDFLTKAYLPVAGGLPQAVINYFTDAANEGLRLDVVSSDDNDALSTNLDGFGLVRVSYEGGSGTNYGLLRIVLTHSIVQ